MSHSEFHAFRKWAAERAWANTFQIEEAPKSMQMSPKPASEPDPQHHHHHQPVPEPTPAPVSVSVAESRNSFSSQCHVKCQRRVLRQLSTACLLRPRPRSHRLPGMHAEARIFACCPSKFRLKKHSFLPFSLTLCSARTFAVSVIWKKGETSSKLAPPPPFPLPPLVSHNWQIFIL